MIQGKRFKSRINMIERIFAPFANFAEYLQKE